MSSQSSTTGNVLGAIGAVVGGIYGGPVGAAQGYAIGSSLGNALDPPKGPTQVGPRLEDKSVQTSTYGATIPRIYGTCKVAGNVFWLEGDQLKEVVKKESSGGKGGGGGAEVKTYTYYATFAVGLCRGPISAVKRIWIGPDLIYDAGSGDIESLLASNAAAKGFTIYHGTDSQLPDSRIQADKGVLNTPSYRGLAYVVFKDLALAKYGNSLAQAQVFVEVVTGLDQELKIPLDAQLYADTTHGYSSGASFESDASGISWLNSRPATSSIAVGISATIRKISAGTQRNLSSKLDAPNADINQSLVGAVSYDGRMWGSYIFNDSIQSVVRKIRSTDGITMSIPSTAGVGFPAYRGELGSGFLEYHLLYASSSTPNTLNILGRYSVFTGSSGNSSNTAISTIGAVSTSWRISTCGSSSFEYSFQSGTLFCRVYNDDLSLLESWSISVPSTDWPSVAQHNFISSSNTAEYYSDGVLYVIRQYAAGQFRVGVFSSSGIIDSYTFSATAVSGICGYLPVTARQGLISCPGRAIHWSFSKGGKVKLSDIVESESTLSGLVNPSDLSVASLTDEIVGYRIASNGSIRNAIEPLRGAWPFDVLQNGYQILYKPRGSSSVASIDIGELGVSEQIREVREMDSQIARKVVVKYLDKSRDYDVNEQYDQRENTDSVNTLSMDLPVVLTSTEAKRVAQKLLYLYWLERSDFTFTLPPEYVYLQPSDVVTIVDDATTYALRIGSIKYMEDGRLECSAKANNAAVYTSIADTDGGLIPPVTIPFPGGSIGLLLDIPAIDETLQNTTGFVGYMTGETTGWTGGAHFVTSDNGQTWSVLQAYAGKGTIGTVRNTLSEHPGTLIQAGGSITVDLYSGQLEGISESQMLNGKNYAAYGADGRWEIIRFQNATLNADGSYTLDTFIRGDRGTEWTTGLHVAGDIFCLMDDPDGSFIYTNTASIGVPRTVRAVTAGADIDSADNESFTYHGVNLECYSPVFGKGARDGSDNLTISWIRRTRIGGEWRSNVDASLGETSEAYEVDIMNGSTVVRTLNSTSQSVAYSAADQTTDFGAPQTSVTCRIYQMSATVGRGYPLEVTV